MLGLFGTEVKAPLLGFHSRADPGLTPNPSHTRIWPEGSRLM